MSDPGFHEQLLALERGQNLTITYEKGGAAPCQSCLWRFQRGRSTNAAGEVTLFTGPPPHYPHSLPEPRIEDDPESIKEALAELAAALTGDVSLKLVLIVTLRLTFGLALIEKIRESSVWSLTGGVRTPNGRFIPIGWSGKGSCLRALGNDERKQHLAALVSRVDQARPLAAGETAAVLSPQAAAVLLHESIGHYSEASPLPQGDFSYRLNHRLASELFDVYDDPLARDGVAQYDLDDEGVASFGPTEIVRQGVLIGQLHSLASAARAQAFPTANGRSTSTWDQPVPRMSNLICRPGTASAEEMVARVGRGLYLHHLSDGFNQGIAVRARVVLAERITGGQRTGVFLSGACVQETTDFLTRAVELGDRAKFNPNGLCGKAGQLLFDVGTCAPAVRLTSLRLTP